MKPMPQKTFLVIAPNTRNRYAIPAAIYRLAAKRLSLLNIFSSPLFECTGTNLKFDDGLLYPIILDLSSLSLRGRVFL